MLGNNESGGIWLKPFDGNWTCNVDDGTPGAKQRTTDSGKVITYKDYDYVEGMLVDIQHKADEWEGRRFDNLLIVLQDADEKYIVKLPLFGRQAEAFFHTMESIDFSDRVRLVATRKDGKNGMIVIQNGEALKWNYTRENPGNRPPKKQVVIQGKETWDSTDMTRWFWGKVTKEILPKIQQVQNTGTDTPADDFNPPAAPAPTPQEQMQKRFDLTPTDKPAAQDDDLPF